MNNRESRPAPMKSVLFMAGVLCLSVLCLYGCDVDRDANAAKDGDQARGVPSAGSDPPSCHEWSGVWRTYEIPAGMKAEMCGDEPCEGLDYAGTLTLVCEGGKLSGVKPLVSATHPPPETKVERQLEIQHEGDGLSIKYADLVRCVVTYKVFLRDAKISGEYSVTNCDDIAWRSKGGKFLAVRSSTKTAGREP